MLPQGVEDIFLAVKTIGAADDDPTNNAKWDGFKRVHTPTVPMCPQKGNDEAFPWRQAKQVKIGKL